ncbi:MAG: glycosyltransferase [Lewinellaceae bacterium]|jgi:glycosyltransferase involved in cell wall biosynthesis|nr:glycosyltransferase [Lewinellaceae bacterium]
MQNKNDHPLSEILFITSYPPRECGIATYSLDLIDALNNKFNNSFSLRVCALEPQNEKYTYPEKVKYVLDTSLPSAYAALADIINRDSLVKIVVIEHEFGFFASVPDKYFLQFLYQINKPLILTFHTVLPRPDSALKRRVRNIAGACAAVIVMTNNAAGILTTDYGVDREKITVIGHGTHLVPHLDKTMLKEKYGMPGRKVLSTFGLISTGKSIETTLEALPEIIQAHPEVLFLIIGKTHPTVVKQEGERYRNMLESRIAALSLQGHVRFINSFLSLPDLLEYLQMTDIYLFTSKDPNQAVSGTFSYAISCACPIISTPIPHAREVLRDDAGIIIDFQNPGQLAAAVNLLLDNKPLRRNISTNGLQRIVSTAWENAATAHALLFQKTAGESIDLQYSLPPVNLSHIKRMTTGFGMIQFAKVNQPDLKSGYTIDDNARAMIAMCMYYEWTGDESAIPYIRTYLDFIAHCIQPEGDFLNYVDSNKQFTEQNQETNLDDANGRTIWALGYLIAKRGLLPEAFISDADTLMQCALRHIETTHSTRAMAFAIKGLYYYHSVLPSLPLLSLMETLADRLVQMYRHEAAGKWKWFEGYLTYGNSILPEALLCAWLTTGNLVYKNMAAASFDFLLEHTFCDDRIKVISNKSWLLKGQTAAHFGEQPIDVAYTILALRTFYDVFDDAAYLHKMKTAFNWFLGNNHLHQIIYNPCTGGCYDGLEESNVNLNQGAESTVSYLMARMTVEQYFDQAAIAAHQPESQFQMY